MLVKDPPGAAKLDEFLSQQCVQSRGSFPYIGLEQLLFQRSDLFCD